MNDHLLHAELAAVLSSDEYEDLRELFGQPPQIHAAQDGADLARPCLTISGEYAPYGPRRKGTLTLGLRSRMGDETAQREHQARVDALLAALLADTAAQEALLDALAARQAVTVATYGAASEFLSASVDGEDLVTRIQLRVAWAFV